MTEQSNAPVYPAPIRKLQPACNRKCPHCGGPAKFIAHEGECSSICCNKKPCLDSARNCVGKQIKKLQDDEAKAKAKRDQRKQENSQTKKGLDLQELANKV